ncbi:oxygenase MpaB family protein [Rhodococcoides fascians]|uniref:oxygenase MpaB family protein n=1 Tax=Rhodococcoides fascians TaxID=1828 RepID=UPI00056295A5|nr:oxygenase MpaB family protein [Rhodococcus fascians]
MFHDPWTTRIESLDPTTDYEEIYRLHYSYEFPWDTVQALSFALFRTYAVPTVGSLLAATGEFTERVQQRYDDTNLILDQVVESGFGSVDGRTAIRRMNRMHGAYDISNEDFLYVLATFVVVPVRWLERFGWRPVGVSERDAMVMYYRTLGRHMGMKEIPETYDQFASYMDEYEQQHFAYDVGSTAVADATLDLMSTFAPYKFLPKKVFRRMAYALMDKPLLDAFHYPEPTKLERSLAEAMVKARARVVRLLPPRTTAYRARDQKAVRSYPAGYRISELGTFPTGCPVDHGPSEPHRRSRR